MSTARLGGDGSSIIPMKSLSAFMYALLRMLPASLIADCSISPSSTEVPAGRRSISSARRTAVGFGNTSSVRPVRSPSMCISTAATGSSGAEICGGTSSSLDTLIVGTLIMMVPPIICDSAVAAWPAPMFATSRRASSCSAFRERMSSMGVPLKETAHVYDQRGCSVAENRGPTEQREPVLHAVEQLDDDLLLADQRIDHQRRAPLSHLDDDDLFHATRRFTLVVQQLPQPDHRQHVLADHQHFAPLQRVQDLRVQLHRLAHVRHRNRVGLVAHPRQQRAHD